MSKQKQLTKIRELLAQMDEKKLTKLRQILSEMGDDILRQEFVEHFEKILESLKKQVSEIEQRLGIKIDKKTEEEIRKLEKLQEEFNQIISKAQKEKDSTFSGIKQKFFETIISLFNKNQVNRKLQEILLEANSKIEEIDEKLSQIKNGKDADINQIALIASEMALKSLESKKVGIDVIQRLKKQLKRIKEELEGLKKRKPDIIYAAGSASGGRICKSYDLSGELNSSTKTFSLPAFWRIISVHLSSFPNILRETTDYTFDASAMTITFTSEIDAASSLASGQTCLVIFSEP